MVSPADILSGKILVVDDLAANVAVLVQMLERAGYTAVTSTQDPFTVAELHRQHRFDVILLDLHMPGLDGFEVMDALKKIETDGYLPVLVLTAQTDLKLRALKAGAKDFISKPFDLSEVRARVHNMLEIRLLHRSESRLAQARLETSQHIAGLGDWEYDFADRRLLWSDEVYRILGLSRQDVAPDSEVFYRQVHPDDLAFVHREKQAAATGARRVNFEHRLIRADGEVRHIHQITSMTLDGQGRPVREAGTLQDITERKVAESALRVSEERYRLMFEQNPTPMWVFDPKTLEFLAVNHATVALYGYSREEFLGLSARDIRPPEAIAEFLRRNAIAPTEFHAVDRSRHRKKDGTDFPVDIFAHGIDFAGRAARLVLAVDRTVAEQAAAALRESEERFKFVARAVSDAVWDWNIVADTVWWNEGFFTTFGYAVREIEPSFGSWSSRIHSADRKRVVESIHAAVAGRTETWSAEYQFERKDGSYAAVLDRGYVLRNAAGEATRMVGGLSDLTEKKKMEAQYLRAQRMDSIGTLAGGIAHDLNNVLAPILMSIELLKLDRTVDAGRTKILDTIFISCRRGADLVRQVMSFARGADGQRIAIRLRHLIGDLEAMISETFPRNLAITLEVANDLWPITGDPTQIHQVLLNLTVNARDAMPDGGKLSVTASNVTVDDRFVGMSREAKSGPYVLLQVSDNGSGIPVEVRDRIFEPFFTTKEVGKGTGIGLATVHTIVKNHGGFITLETELGAGTSFKVYLPADEALRTGQTPHPFVVDLPRGRGELVLVADDEFSIREIMKQTLEAFGYRVISASDGDEAIALYAMQQAEIAVVVTDMMMPIMDGAAAIQALTAMNPSIRIIAASGIESGQNVAKAENTGAKDFLLKPFSAERLLTLVREVIDRPVAVVK